MWHDTSSNRSRNKIYSSHRHNCIIRRREIERVAIWIIRLSDVCPRVLWWSQRETEDATSSGHSLHMLRVNQLLWRTFYKFIYVENSKDNEEVKYVNQIIKARKNCNDFRNGAGVVVRNLKYRHHVICDHDIDGSRDCLRIRIKSFFLWPNSVSRCYRISDGIYMKIYVDETTDDIPERIRNMMDEEGIQSVYCQIRIIFMSMYNDIDYF